MESPLNPGKSREMAGPTQVKVLIVDDQEIIREMLAMTVSAHPGMALVGTLPDGDSAVKSVKELRPDVIIMDVMMPGLNGIAAARRIREDFPEAGIILLTAYEDSRFVREFLKDDPRGKSYLLKHTLGTIDELIRTIQDVDAGRTVLDPIMVEKLTSDNGVPDGSPLKTLTRREFEVLSLMSKACTNSTIASILYIQPRTVEHHINSIFSKLHVVPEEGQHARVQAVLSYLNTFGGTAEEAIV